MVHSHLYLIRDGDDSCWDDNSLYMNDDDDDDFEIFVDDDAKELEIKIITMFGNSVSLVNNKGYFLLEFGESGLLCESDVRTTIYDLEDRHLKIIGVDII
jgi:hypothetical protein